MSDDDFTFVDKPTMSSPLQPTVTSAPSSPPAPQASPAQPDVAAPPPSSVTTVVGHAVPTPDSSPAWWDGEGPPRKTSPPHPNRQLAPMLPPPPSGVSNVPGTTTTAIRLKKLKEVKDTKAPNSVPPPPPPPPPPMNPPPPGFVYTNPWSNPIPPPSMPPVSMSAPRPPMPPVSISTPLPPMPPVTMGPQGSNMLPIPPPPRVIMKNKKKNKAKATFPMPPPPPPPPPAEFITYVPPPSPPTFVRDRISRRRSISPSPSPPRRWTGLENFDSSFLLFRPNRWGDSVLEERDSVVRLAPFDKKVYVTRHAATPVEFERYLPLIRYGVADCWYDLSSPEVQILIQSLVHLPQTPSNLLLPTVRNARSQNQDIPRIAATAALMTPADGPVSIECQHDGDHSDAESDDEDMDHASSDSYCSPCSRMKAMALSDDTELKYYSIIQSIQLSNDMYIPSPGDGVSNLNGIPMHKVVVTGSREAAAAEAFYNAGANGWSTVFTCCIRADAERDALNLDSVDRVEKFWKLADDENDIDDSGFVSRSVKAFY